MSIPKLFDDSVIRDWTHDDKTNTDTLRARFVVTQKVVVPSESNTGDVPELVEEGAIETLRNAVLKIAQDEPIIKCRHCRYFNTQPKCSNDYGMYWCARWRDYGASPDGFCAWGEVKDNERP